MNVLAIDVGGTNIKVLATGHETRRKFPSGPKMTAKQMVDEVRKVAADWTYDVVSIGYPGVVYDNHILTEPHNLGRGWAGFNFERAFGRPVRIINDAAMQALGSYKGGRMLFLGLGTGLGSAMIVDGQLQPMELAHLPYRKGTYEDYVGLRGLEGHGKKKWRKYVADVVETLAGALEPDDIVLGGGNVKFLESLPAKCRAGSNANAFIGGYRLWADTSEPPVHPAPPHPASVPKGRSVHKKRVNGKDARG
jgi:polyphosphate glucokinase